METTFNAWDVSRYGGPDVLTSVSRPVPTPTARQVLVRIRASAVSRADSMMRAGQPKFARLFLGLSRPRSGLVGTCFSGDVVAVGEEVWHLIGDFCDIDDWHPKVSSCALKVMDGSLVRVLTTDNGDQVTHKRIAQEDGLSYTYKTISPALPIEKFTATLSVQPGENLLIEWIANFTSDDPAMERVVVEDIEGGLSAIKNIMTSR